MMRDVEELVGKYYSKKYVQRNILRLTDNEIEKASNLKVPDFFEKYGEVEFRELEKKIFSFSEKICVNK